jgi:hypothetical protein
MIKLNILCSLIALAFLFSCNSYEYNSFPESVLVDSVDFDHIVVKQEGFDSGGNTSVDHDLDLSYKWSGETPYKAGSWGYFDSSGVETPYMMRNRDLGQTFTYHDNEAKQLKSVTVRLGFGSNVIRNGMYGQSLSIQFFKVTGDPVINENGTTGNDLAFHGYPHDRFSYHVPAKRDDYFEGEEYEHLAVISGFRFPFRRELGFETADTITIDPNHPNLKGKYLKFKIPEYESIILNPGQRYAFLIMIDEPGEGHGFTLANLFDGNYDGGHGIRREGDGIFPPAKADPEYDFTHSLNSAALKAARLPVDFDERISLSPGTNGYPDVDTWRDLEFYIEAR